MRSYSAHSRALYILFPRLLLALWGKSAPESVSVAVHPHRQDRKSHSSLLALSHNKKEASIDDKKSGEKEKKKKREPKHISTECHLRLCSLSGSIFTVCRSERAEHQEVQLCSAVFC